MILVGVCITLTSGQEKPNIVLLFADDVSNATDILCNVTSYACVHMYIGWACE